MNTEKENILIKNKHILICIDEQLSNINSEHADEVNYIKKYFCGNIITDLNSFDKFVPEPNTIIYICGNIKQNLNQITVNNNMIIYIIRELSCNYEDYLNLNYKFIQIGELPININNVGIYFRNFFDENKNYFDLINNEHNFQTLKESNKPNNAFRSGIYMTKVTESINSNEINFNLLRCSTNLDGSTDNFRDIDKEIVDKVNNIAEYYYEEKTNLNHVLAQIYKNTFEGGEDKKSVSCPATDPKLRLEKKAKIKEHSDKTKDMPRNGLIAFCTFYENYFDGTFQDMKIKKFNKSNLNYYDYCYNNTSVLTKMRFRLKKDVTDGNFVKQFDIILYPNSVFLISLEMNRLYTHEIVPSVLLIAKIPTRMGYVIRCSKTKAIYKDNQTYLIQDNSERTKLEKPNNEGIKILKKIYFDENMSSNMITYDKFYFSLNDGDYQKPNL